MIPPRPVLPALPPAIPNPLQLRAWLADELFPYMVALDAYARYLETVAITTAAHEAREIEIYQPGARRRNGFLIMQGLRAEHSRFADEVRDLIP